MADMMQKSIPEPGFWTSFRSFLHGVALLRESPVGMIGAALVGFWVFIAIFAPFLAPYDPNATMVPFQMPGTTAPDGGMFLLGTDMIGRDITSRLIWGARTVMFYAPLATASAYIVGIMMGLAAGYRRGWWDVILSRIADIILSFPVLVLFVIVISRFGASGTGSAGGKNRGAA